MGTLVFTPNSDDSVNGVFVPEGALCEGCQSLLSAEDAHETDDMVLLCGSCFADCIEENDK